MRKNQSPHGETIVEDSIRERHIETQIYVVLTDIRFGQDRLTKLVRAFQDEETAQSYQAEKTNSVIGQMFYIESIILEG